MPGRPNGDAQWPSGHQLQRRRSSVSGPSAFPADADPKLPLPRALARSGGEEAQLAHVRAAPFCGAGFCQRNPSNRRRAGMAHTVSLDPTQAHHMLPVRKAGQRRDGRFPSAARISRCLRFCTEEGTRRGGMAMQRHRRAGGRPGSRMRGIRTQKEGFNKSIDRAR